MTEVLTLKEGGRKEPTIHPTWKEWKTGRVTLGLRGLPVPRVVVEGDSLVHVVLLWSSELRLQEATGPHITGPEGSQIGSWPERGLLSTPGE